jgi:hypothetical protein
MEIIKLKEHQIYYLKEWNLLNNTTQKIVNLDISESVFVNSIDFLKQAYLIKSFKEPLVNKSIDNEIVFEWWHEDRKLVVYIENHNLFYIKVWGVDIDSQMSSESFKQINFIYLWNWLIKQEKLGTYTS